LPRLDSCLGWECLGLLGSTWWCRSLCYVLEGHGHKCPASWTRSSRSYHLSKKLGGFPVDPTWWHLPHSAEKVVYTWANPLVGNQFLRWHYASYGVC
jgi:hypothetical protein